MRKIKFITSSLIVAILLTCIPTKSNADYYIYLPLSAFTSVIRSYIEEYDEDNDGILKFEELGKITYLNLSHDSRIDDEALQDMKYLPCLKKLDISYCPNAHSLTLDGYNCAPEHGYKTVIANNSGLTSITLKHCKILEQLKLEDSKIKNINLSGCPKLNTLYIEGTQVNSFYLGCCPILCELVQNTTVDSSDSSYDYYYGVASAELSCNPGCVIGTQLPENCYNVDEATFPDYVARDYLCENYDIDNNGYLSEKEINSVEEITCKTIDCLKYFPNIKTVNITEFRKDYLDLSDFTDIEYLNITDCTAEIINLSGLSKLKRFELSSARNLKSVTLPNNSDIELVSIYWCRALSDFDFSKLTKVEAIYLDDVALDRIDLSNCSQLDVLSIHDTNISTLDISKSPDIHYVEVYSNTGMTELDISHNTNLLNVYVDKDYTYFYSDISDLDTEVNGRWVYSGSGEDRARLIFGVTITIVVQPPTPTTTPATTPGGGTSSGSTPTSNPTTTVAPTGGAGSGSTPTSAPTVTSVPTSSQTTTSQPTVAPTVASTSSPTSAVAPTVVPTTAPELDVGDFINRCYSVALGREADEGGYNYWVESLTGGQACGAQVGYGFIFSQEYINKDRTNEEFVTDMYAMYFGRSADSDGFNYWVGLLESGSTREDIMAGFANSEEFYNLCNKYGVVCGTYLVGVPNDVQGGVNCFVARMYKVCLNRLPDMGGQAGWVLKLMNGDVTGTSCAYGFVFSPEFIGKNPSNEDFVNYMYAAFFGREADEAGFNAWVDVLNGGGSYEDVFAGFSGSAEFANLCASYGIQA